MTRNRLHSEIEAYTELQLFMIFVFTFLSLSFCSVLGLESLFASILWGIAKDK